MTQLKDDDKRFRTCSWCCWWYFSDHLATVSSNFLPALQLLHQFPRVVGTAWKAHDIDVVRCWLAAGKTTTVMAMLRPKWSKSSIKKLVARLKARAAAGDAPGPVLARKRSFTAVSSAQVDELKAELPTLPRVSVAAVVKKLRTSSSTAWRVLHNRLEKTYKPIKAQRVSAATVLRRLALCRFIRLRLGARLRLCKGPSLPTLNLQRVFFSDEKVYKCQYLQHPQNFRYWVDRARKRMHCAALLRPTSHTHRCSLSVTSLSVLQLCSEFQVFSTLFPQFSITFSTFLLFPTFFGQSDASPCDLFVSNVHHEAPSTVRTRHVVEEDFACFSAFLGTFKKRVLIP